MPLDPARIDLAAAAAWPAEEVAREGGWLLRRSPAIPRRRSNTALPLRDDADPAVVRRFYGAGALVSVPDFRPALDAALAGAGWAAEQPTVVLAAELDAPPPPPSVPVAVVERPAARWLEAWARCERRDDVEVRAAELAAERGTAAFALAPRGSAAGMAIEADGLLGLFSLAVDERHRRRGLGTALVHALCGWGAGRGADGAYLQVLEANAPAMALYGRLGFEPAYRYHYRRAPADG